MVNFLKVVFKCLNSTLETCSGVAIGSLALFFILFDRSGDIERTMEGVEMLRTVGSTLLILSVILLIYKVVRSYHTPNKKIKRDC